MTAYADHSTLTPARLAVLIRLARQERVEIQRIQAAWFIREGWLERTSPRDKPPRYGLTAKAMTLPEICSVASLSATASAADTRYRSDSVKRGPARQITGKDGRDRP